MNFFAAQKLFTSKIRQVTTVPMGKYIRIRCLIIGAQKCGTSSMLYMLLRNPMLHRGIKGEVKYFSNNYDRGVNWYHSLFPSTYEIDPHHDLLEKSPSYIYKPQCAERIYKYNSDMRMVLLLRNPVDRAFSDWSVPNWNHFGFETFEDAIEDQIKRIQTGDPEFGGDAQPAYLYRGLYALQIKRYLKYFPKDQLLIFEDKQLYKDPVGVYQKTLDFFGLPPYEIELSDLQNRNMTPNKATIKPETRQRLQEFFRPYNEELFELLGWRYNWD